MSTPALSIVTPVRDEGAVLAALVEGAAAAAREAVGEAFEHVVVDDASRDDSAERLARLAADRHVVPICLEKNLGQLGATRAGLAQARGPCVVVLDGDLQDPPEVIPALVGAMGPGVDVVFAVKVRRVDPAWFVLGRVGYRALARLGSGAPPSGSGSYCALGAELARRAADTPIRDANLAALLAALGARRWRTVPYDKGARYDGRSRVGAIGLAREALGSLLLLGALERLFGLAALVALAALWPLGPWPLGPGGVAIASGLLGAGVVSAVLRRIALKRPRRQPTS